MKKPILILFILAFFCCFASAQDFPFGKITDAEMNMKNYAKDISAHAVVLQEFGSSRINVSSGDDIKVFFEYHVKIKIFDAKGFENGTVKLPVYNNSSNDTYETIENITALTHYKDDNGLIRTVELENKKIYPVKASKHLAYYNFALPGLHDGCVIEYKYTKESLYWWDFPSWEFQSDIPKIYSQYEAHIPGFWTFKPSLKGFLKLTKSSADVETKCFTAGSANCDCSFLVYGMSDIPAFIEEDYMTSKNNYLSTINFELEEFINPYTGTKTKWTKEWKDIDFQLKKEDEFGGQLKKKSLFKDRVVPVISGKTDDLDKAKAIYVYIQKLFKWNNDRGIYSSDGLNKALDSHSGNDADINLSLISALSSVGLNTEAVLLSTRDNGKINTLYPVVSDFDYVVAKVNINNQSYLLDATDPLLPFGMLPLRCLNDQGRVFSLDKPSYWMDLNVPQKESTTCTMDLTLLDNGKLKGTITNYFMGYEAYEKRVAIKKFNTMDEYVEDLYSKSPKVKVLKSEINNIDSLDLAITEKYEVEITVFDKANADRLSFNPFFLTKIDENPFKLLERSYPVDMGVPKDYRIILTVKLPPQYAVDSPPQIVAVALPNGGGKFLTEYETDNNSFTFSHVIKFNKSVYSPEEYPYLKEFYNKIILSEKAEMIFKKK